MQFTTIDYRLDQHILTITLQRPGRMNAFTPTMALELIAAFDLADADDAVRAIVVTGHDRAFCAGADLAEGADTFNYDKLDEGEGVSPSEGIRDTGGTVALRIYQCLKPVIGAINGAAVGIGATMTLPMDIRIASDKARFGFVFSRRGIVPEAASSWFLPRVVGISQALEWCYRGQVFDAAEALRGGLVREVVASEALLDTAYAMARDIADNNAPVSVAMTRQMMWRMLGESHPMAAHRIDSYAVYQRGQQSDSAEGVASFLDKRAPVFSDKPSSDMPAVYPWFEEPDFE